MLGNVSITPNYSEIDEFLALLIVALNENCDVKTFACCEGHGRDQFYISLFARGRNAREWLLCGFNGAFVGGNWIDYRIELRDSRFTKQFELSEE